MFVGYTINGYTITPLIQFLVFGAFTQAVIQELIKHHKLNCVCKLIYYQTKPLICLCQGNNLTLKIV